MGAWKTAMIAVMLSLLFLSGCRRYNVPPVSVVDADPFPRDGILIPPVARKPILLPDDSAANIYQGLHKKTTVLEFYARKHYHPVWMNPAGVDGLADSMVRFVRNIRIHGLLPQRYHAEELYEGGDEDQVTENVLRRDVLLTDAFLSIAKDLQLGRLRDATPADDSVHRVLLDSLVTHGGMKRTFKSLEPLLHAYQSLKHGLRVLFDTIAPVERALLLGGLTLDSLPLHRAVQSIELNMERWRWEKNGLGDRFILVNIPSFMAEVYAHDTLVLESRVIVGKPDHPTPRLTSVIQCFITYPYWHVPRKIAVDELLPAIKKDRGYIHRNNFDVLDRRGRILDPDTLDWGNFNKNNFPVTLRQREGADNSLGVLKFSFDNPFAVFLHDTNARSLFQHETRAYSHGCIRMEKAITFAHYLVTDDVHTKSPMLEKFLKEAKRHNVDLANPIAIHVRYITAEVKGEQLHLFDDVYNKDRAVIAKLYK